MNNLQGKVAVVTASITGIGNTCLEKLASQGATTYLAAHLKNESLEAIEVLKNKGYNVKYTYFDATDDTTHQAMIKDVLEQEGKIDILVNNFGITDPQKDLDLVSGDTDSFFQTLHYNIASVYLTCKEAIPAMIKNGGGSIINISSVASATPDVSRLAYTVSKSAINSLTQNIALQYARFGVRCNAVLPGMTLTPALRVMPSEFLKAFERHIPIGRAAQPEDIANVVAFLASDESAYLTGSLQNLGGGFGLGTPLYADIMSQTNQ